MTPYVAEVGFDRESLDRFVEEQASSRHRENDSASSRLLDYPTVYVVHNERSEKYSVYIGETSDVRSRTIQHLEADPNLREDWKELATSGSSNMYIVGHDLFNKSLTLDVENRLMQYLSGVDAVEHLYNRRSNPQNNYYTAEYLDEVFTSIWTSLRQRNKALFPTERVIRDSALFKASPFHKLSAEQLDAKRKIYKSILSALKSEEVYAPSDTGKLILVSGEAGAGKTVLLSSLFYELFQGQTNPDEPFEFQDLDAYMCVNHKEQLTVYESIAIKLGMMKSSKDDRVLLPTRFINKHPADRPVDVVLIDEAHLLLTRGNQGYSGKNHLRDILRRAKVVVAVFDENQILTGDQYWEDGELNWLNRTASEVIQLRNQLRMDAAPETIEWVKSIVHSGEINQLVLDDQARDKNGYVVRVFDSPQELHEAVVEIATDESETERGLSRLIASYDWPYVDQKQGPGKDGMWTVAIGSDFEVPWNYQRRSALSPQQRKATKNLAWAEQSHTIDEVGSTFTIQGFDLNYAGVIIGPSVTYRNGRVSYDPSKNANAKVTNMRTLSDGTKLSVAERLIQNELNVLLTRGVHGLYIYAVDEELQKALIKATRKVNS